MWLSDTTHFGFFSCLSSSPSPLLVPPPLLAFQYWRPQESGIHSSMVFWSRILKFHSDWRLTSCCLQTLCLPYTQNSHFHLPLHISSCFLSALSPDLLFLLSSPLSKWPLFQLLRSNTLRNHAWPLPFYLYLQNISSHFIIQPLLTTSTSTSQFKLPSDGYCKASLSVALLQPSPSSAPPPPSHNLFLKQKPEQSFLFFHFFFGCVGS